MGQSKLRAEGTAALCKTGRLYRNVFLSLVILLSAQYYNCTHVQAPLDSFWFFRFSHLQIFKPLLLVFQLGTMLSFYSNLHSTGSNIPFWSFSKTSPRGSETSSFAHVECFTSYLRKQWVPLLECSDNVLLKFPKTPRATRRGKSYPCIYIILEVNKYLKQLKNE